MSAATKLTFNQALERVSNGHPTTLIFTDEDVRAEARPMRVDCAWCGKLLVAGDPPISHGICDACAIQQGYADQADVLKPEDLTPGESDAEVAAAMDRCRPAVEAAAFEIHLPDAIVAGAARGIARVMALGLRFVVGIVNGVGAWFIGREVVAGIARTLGIAFGFTVLVVAYGLSR